MGSKANASKRKPAAARTGTRKGKKNVTQTSRLSSNPATTPSPTPRARPKPRPITKAPSTPEQHTEESVPEEEAAQVLMSLSRKRLDAPMDRVFKQVLNLPDSDGMGEGEENDGNHFHGDTSDEEGGETDGTCLRHVSLKYEPVLTYHNCKDDSDLPTLPIGSPRRKFPEFEMSFEVPYKTATRDLVGIKSTTKFSEFLVKVAEKMET